MSLSITSKNPPSTHHLDIIDNSDGGFDILANGYRVVHVSFGGGQFHFSLPGSLPSINETDIGTPVDETGHITIAVE